jgi:hypothetical protein
MIDKDKIRRITKDLNMVLMNDELDEDYVRVILQNYF